MLVKMSEDHLGSQNIFIFSRGMTLSRRGCATLPRLGTFPLSLLHIPVELSLRVPARRVLNRNIISIDEILITSTSPGFALQV